jgi:hypothetical protein
MQDSIQYNYHTIIVVSFKDSFLYDPNQDDMDFNIIIAKMHSISRYEF